MTCEVVALPFQAHANYGTWLIDFGFNFEEPGHFSMLEQGSGFNLLRTSFYVYLKRFALEKIIFYVRKKNYIEILISLLQNAINTFYNLYYDYLDLITKFWPGTSNYTHPRNLKVVRTKIKSIPNNSII